MKHIRQFAILLALMSSIIGASAANKENGLFQNDPAVRTGKLKNGLTYYIRHNEEPKNRAFFYIAQKVGAIQEDPNQRGLAHFLEHMCFNGTTHFPGTSLRTYLETIGVKFGADLNAYTAVDETVYNIDNVPLTTSGAIDSCLLILHDWSHDLTLDPEEIDKERGVIQEEWRQRNTVTQRLNEQMMPVIMAGSKYADAMPIGSMDIVMNFPYDALRDYYQKWYRPDLQAVVVVGDIDVNEIEKKIKRVFADIPKPRKDAAKRIYYPVPDNQQPIYSCATDKEMPSPNVTFYFKYDAMPQSQKNSRQYMIDRLFGSFADGMYHDHTLEIAQKPNAPFALAYTSNGGFFLAETKRALAARVNCHNTKDGIVRGTEAMLRELWRIRQNGFTSEEFERYRNNMLSRLDEQLKNRDKRSSRQFVNECVRNFLDGQPYPTTEDEVAFWKEELPRLTVDDLNKWFRSLFHEDGSNIVIAVNGPANDSIQMPSADEMTALYKRVGAEKLAPYMERKNDLPFLPIEPMAGSIVSESEKDGLTTLSLSNGAKVIVKKTDLQKDQILVQAMAHGGASQYPVEKYKYAPLISMMTQVSGWGNYSFTDMERKFAGRHANMQSGIADNYQTVTGACNGNDLQLMMEKIHAAFLYPHKDPDAFGALVDRLKRGLRESEGKADRVFGDSLQHTLYGHTPHTQQMTVADYEQVNQDTLLALYRQRFADASNFTFTFVGDVQLEVLRPLVEKYIASLPSTYRHEVAIPIKDVLLGSRQCIFTKEQETPKATIVMNYIAPTHFDRKQMTIAEILGQILTMTYTQTIREDAGAAYSVMAGATVDFYPREQERIVVQFPTDPKNQDLAIHLVDEGIRHLAEKEPASTEVDKIKEYLLKVYDSNRKQNAYWQYALSFEWNHPDMSYDAGYADMVRSITPRDVQQMAQHILKEGSRILVVMSSE